MPIKREDLQKKQKDYFLARWENEELIMEPFCYCGSPLEEDYFCEKCKRQCTCTFVACKDPETLSVVRKFIHGNPRFREFEASLLDEES